MSKSEPRRRRLRVASAGTTAVVGVAMVVAPAFATGGGTTTEAPSEQGWWTAAASPIGLSDSALADPGVPDHGLEVQGSASDVVAMAALKYAVKGTSNAEITLRLTVAPDSTTVPGSKVQACPLLPPGSFAPASGGPLSKAPKYDCTTSTVGVEDPSSGTVTLNLGRFVTGSTLAVAILPAGTADRVIFAAPSTESLTILMPSVAPPTGAPNQPTGPPNQSASGIPGAQTLQPKMTSKVPQQRGALVPAVVATPVDQAPAIALEPSTASSSNSPAQATPLNQVAIGLRALPGPSISPAEVVVALLACLLAARTWLRGSRAARFDRLGQKSEEFNASGRPALGGTL